MPGTEGRQPTLNYKFRLYPTRPQRQALARQLREVRVQYNRAVALFGPTPPYRPRRGRKTGLRGTLQCGKAGVVLRQILSLQKSNTQANRAKAISSLIDTYPTVPLEDLPLLYDLRGVFGKAFAIEPRHVDLSLLAAEVEPLLRAELEAGKAYYRLPKGDRPRKPPPRPIYWALSNGIVRYAGIAAKHSMDRDFPAAQGTVRSGIRFRVSGSGDKSTFDVACKPSPDQRKLGNTGDPQFHRRHAPSESYSYQEIANPIDGDHIHLKGLPVGLERVRLVYHRPLPPGTKPQRLTVLREGLEWYAVLACEVTEEAYRLTPAHPTSAIGIDPGSHTALTAAHLDTATGELTYDKTTWEPLAQSLEQLERLSQRLSRMRGPDRRKRRPASQRWLKLNAQRTKLHARIRHQRADLLHKVARHLADYGFVAIGGWEPPKRVKGRKAFQGGKGEVVQPGPKGIVAARRDARDKSIATLRRLTAEKVGRSGGVVYTHADESYTTRRCSSCGEMTGPANDLSVREWDCICGAHHDRDENAALNILMLALEQHRMAEAAG